MMKILLLDGDQVGKKLDHAILTNDLDGFANLSEDISSYFRLLANILQASGLVVVMQGGDSLAAKGNLERDLVLKILSIKGPVTVSIGVGPSILNAFLAMRFAKSEGGSCGFEFFNNPDTGFLFSKIS